MKNQSCSSNADELKVRSELRAFARLILPLYEAEYRRQMTSPQPCWMFLTILERRMRELEKQAK